MLKLNRLAFFLIGSLLWNSSYSQENFVTGSVITNDRDTLYGLIDYQYWELNPYKVSFKPDAKSASISYAPNDIIEYRVNNEIFVRGQVASNETEEVETVFLQTIFNSKKSLYYYKSNSGVVNFYTKQGGRFELLIKKDKKYIEQLSVYLSDCPKVSKMIIGTAYTKFSLKKLFDNYFFNSHTYVLFRQKYVSKVEYGVLAGASLTKIDFSKAQFNFLHLLDTTEFSASYNFSGGLFLNVLLPWSKWRWSIYNELLYSSYKVNGSIKFITAIDDYVIYRTEFALSYIKLNNLLRIKYSIGQTSIFINGGISNGYAFKQSNIEKRESQNPGEPVYNSDFRPIHRVRSYEVGWIAGVGVKHKNVSLEIRYEKGNGMEDYSAIETNINRYFLLLGYTF